MRHRPVQPRSGSFLEALANVVFGFVLALVIQMLAYPLFGIHTSFATDGMLAAIFTLASLVRSYLVRRAFESLARSERLLPSIKAGSPP